MMLEEVKMKLKLLCDKIIIKWRVVRFSIRMKKTSPSDMIYEKRPPIANIELSLDVNSANKKEEK